MVSHLCCDKAHWPHWRQEIAGVRVARAAVQNGPSHPQHLCGTGDQRAKLKQHRFRSEEGLRDLI